MLILARSVLSGKSGIGVVKLEVLGGNGICTTGSGKATGAEPERALTVDSNPKLHPEQGVQKGDGAPERFKSIFSSIIGFFINININLSGGRKKWMCGL